MPTEHMSAWQAEHAGRLLDTVAYVWSDDDDECGCTQAVIVEQYENKIVGPPWVVPVTIWSGPMHHDFEPGAQDELDAELARRSRDDLAATSSPAAPCRHTSDPTSPQPSDA